jgi:hypothetical protein
LPDATYRVNIKATKGNETAEKILAVTVTNVDEAPTIRILGYGYSEGFFSRLGRESPGEKGGTGGTLATNKNSDIDSVSFAIVGGADVSKFLVCVFRCRNINRGNMKCPIVIRILGYEAPTGVSISGMVDGVDVDSPLGYDGGKVGVNKRVTLFANGIDVDSPLVYEWIVPTGIITDLPSSKVNLLASASSNIVKLAPPLLVASVITLSVFSGV